MATRNKNDAAIHPFIRQKLNLSVMGYLRSEQKRLKKDIPVNLQNVILKFYAFIHQLRIFTKNSKGGRDSIMLERHRHSLFSLLRLNSPATLWFTIGALGTKVTPAHIIPIPWVDYTPGMSIMGIYRFSWYFQVPNNVRCLHFHVVGLGGRGTTCVNASKVEREKSETCRFDGKLTYCTSGTDPNWNGLGIIYMLHKRKMVIHSYTGTVAHRACQIIEFDVDFSHYSSHSFGIDMVMRGSHTSYTVVDFELCIEDTASNQ